MSAELALAAAASKPFETEGDDPTLPAAAIRQSLLKLPANEADAGCLWIRATTIVGRLDLGSIRIAPRIRFDDCSFTDRIDFSQAEVPDLQFNDCKLEAGVWADQIEIRWNLGFDESEVEGGIRLMDAKIDGLLTLIGATVRGEERDGEVIAVDMDRGQAGGLIADEISTTGTLRLLGATISAQLSLNDAVLEGVANDAGATRALYADGAVVAGGIFGEGARIHGEIKLVSSRLGPLTLTGATLRGAGAGGYTRALSAEGSLISGGMWCDRADVVGELRLISARIEGQLSLNHAQIASPDVGQEARALGAEDIEVTAGIFCEALEVKGEMMLSDARIGSRLLLLRASLEAGEPGRALVMSGATVDELVLAFSAVEGLVDLQQTEVRSLFDAHEGRYLGALPAETRLDGFSYKSLREPLDAEMRLEWADTSQGSHYYPGVYAELADAFRRIGRRADARRVAIAGDRRGHEALPKWSPRRFWSQLLFWTIGYGYRNWLAAVWLGFALLVGWLAFLIGEGSFERLQAKPPAFDPALYAIDVTIPVLDTGQQSAWAPTGGLVWVSLALTVGGYALATAVIAAAAGLLNRDQS